MVAYVFTLHLKACDQFSMVWPLDEFKGPDKFMVLAIGNSVKWPSDAIVAGGPI